MYTGLEELNRYQDTNSGKVFVYRTYALYSYWRVLKIRRKSALCFIIYSSLSDNQPNIPAFARET